MTTIGRLSRGLVAIAFMAATVSCSAENSENEETGAPPVSIGTPVSPDQTPATTTGQTVTDQLDVAGEFSTLLELVEGQDIDLGTLTGSSYTLVALTDTAFSDLPAGQVEALQADPEALQAFLLDHVIDGAVPARVLPTLAGQALVTRAGTSVQVEFANDEIGLLYESGQRLGIAPEGFSGPSGVIIVANRVDPATS